jgi:hypothetical protein
LSWLLAIHSGGAGVFVSPVIVWVCGCVGVYVPVSGGHCVACDCVGVWVCDCVCLAPQWWPLWSLTPCPTWPQTSGTLTVATPPPRPRTCRAFPTRSRPSLPHLLTSPCVRVGTDSVPQMGQGLRWVGALVSTLQADP